MSIISKVSSLLSGEENKVFGKESTLISNPSWSEMINEESAVDAAGYDFDEKNSGTVSGRTNGASIEYNLGRLNWGILRSIVSEMKIKGHEIALTESSGLIQKQFKVHGKHTAVRIAATTFAGEMQSVGEICTFGDLATLGIHPKVIDRVFKESLESEYDQKATLDDKAEPMALPKI